MGCYPSEGARIEDLLCQRTQQVGETKGLQNENLNSVIYLQNLWFSTQWAFKKYYDILYWMRIPELPEVPDELQLPSTDFDNEKAKLASELLEENEWIDVDEDLPYNHKELLLTEGRTIDVLTKDENEVISSDFMIKFNNVWYWNKNCDSDYSHWMIMPTD